MSTESNVPCAPPPSATRQQAEDWADRLALEIALDMRTRGTQDACSLVAARLRLVKAEGERDGLDRAGRAISGALHEIAS